MKKLIFALGMLMSTMALADRPLPADTCAGLRNDCTPWMYELINDFREASDVLVEEGAYRGYCHFHSRDYGSTPRHAAALYLLPGDEGQVYFNGTFHHFGQADRYADWTLEDARARYTNPYRHELLSFGDHSVANYSPDAGLWLYWVSQNPETKEVYVIHYAGFYHRSFCRFEAVE